MCELKWITDSAPGLASDNYRPGPRSVGGYAWRRGHCAGRGGHMARADRAICVGANASDPLMFAIAPPEGGTFVTPAGPVGQPWLALSPDGRVLAFVAVSADCGNSSSGRLAMTSAHPLPGTDCAQAPFWSPDSRSVAFFARGKLKVVDAAGSTPQIVTDAPGYFGSGSWNRENTIVFASSPRNEGLRERAGPRCAGQPNPHAH